MDNYTKERVRAIQSVIEALEERLLSAKSASDRNSIQEELRRQKQLLAGLKTNG